MIYTSLICHLDSNKFGFKIKNFSNSHENMYQEVYNLKHSNPLY